MTPQATPFSIVQAFGYFNQNSGEFKHRILWPGEALERTGRFCVRNLHIYHPHFGKAALEADLLIIHFLSQGEVLRLIRQRKALGRPTVYEIPDNFLSLGSFAESQSSLRDPIMRQNCFQYAALCDALQFTTQDLADRFSFLNPNHAIFANQLPQAPPPIQPREGPFVFGWGGSHSHSDDLAYMAEAVKTFCSRHEDVVFSYMGHEGNFNKHFGDIPTPQKRFTPFGPMEQYQAFIQNLWVGIAVLAPSGFSTCRSDVKYLEYAAGGAAPLLSRANIYEEHGSDGSRARLFDDGPQLLELLEYYYNSPQQRQLLAEAAHRYVQTRTHDAHVARKSAWYEALLGEPAGPLKEIEPASHVLHMILELAPLMAAGHHQQALAAIDQILALSPNHAYATFCRIKTLFLMGDKHWPTLVEMMARTPIPLFYEDRVGEIMFEVARAMGDDGRATQYYEMIEDPVRRLYLEPEPEHEVRFYRQVLELNPYDFKALVTLARLLSQKRRVGEEAEHLITLACLLLPEAEELHKLRTEIQEARKRGRRPVR